MVEQNSGGRRGLKPHSALVLLLIVLSLLIVTVKSDTCPETVSSACINCENDQCTECDDRYWLNGNDCSPCSANCLTCQNEELCYDCDTYYVQVNYQCVGCQDKHCMFCNPDPTVCSGCETDYELSSDSTCRYKYTLYFVILIAIAVCLLFICIISVNSCISARIKRRRERQGYGLVLDKDSMMKPAHSIVVTHVQDIGKTADLNDISTVGLRNPQTGSGSEPKPFRSEELLAERGPPKSNSFLDPNGEDEDREIVEAISQAGSVVDKPKIKQIAHNWD